MIKLVVVDFDDTLCLTEQFSFDLENFVAQKMGFQPMTWESHRKNWGKPIREAIVERIPGIDPDVFMVLQKEAMAEFARQGKMDVIPKENLKTLDELILDGKKIGILTSRRLHEIEHFLQIDHPLRNRVEKVYHVDNSIYHKPDPRVFDQVLQDFDVKPAEVVYVGDAVIDGLAAKGAGVHFIATLESGLRTKEDFQSVPVDHFIRSFPEVVSYIISH